MPLLRQLLVTITALALSISLVASAGCSFAASPQLYRGRVDCSNVRGAHSVDRAAAVTFGVLAASLIVVGAVAMADDGKEREECQNNGGGPCEGSLLPGFLMAGGLLAAPFALGYGVGSAAGSDKVAACERRVRSTAPRAAR